MAEYYRIIGAEMSPYSVKVRSYFRYKAIPHQWVLRNAESQAEFEKYAKVPIIPLAGRLWVRISAQIYNEPADYDRLGAAVDALAARGWQP